ncbi:DUF6298 domain-containing protein [Paraflavisolibacter sp. H34]|uniref:DUF6298 domain-containing protein n=1 Tax=Huijunlia imazamoxiresistens TaxID=3127457 RepID=UPI003017A516
MRPTRFVCFALLALLAGLFTPFCPEAQPTSSPIDFSYAGYGGGGVRLPVVPAVLSVSPTGGDDTRLLQAALNELARQPLGADGFRGALQLSAGVFRISGSLRLDVSGLVLRGSPDSTTVMVATGNSRRALIEAGAADTLRLGAPEPVTDPLVPAGSRVLSVGNSRGFRAGERIAITRPSTKEWIESIGMQALWPAGTRNLVWHRTIEAVDRDKGLLRLDAPLTTALAYAFGSGTVAQVEGGGPVRNIGIEHLQLRSEYNPANPKDEEHAWFGILLDRVEDAWVDNVTARHFAGSAVRVGPAGRRITVEGCRNEQPVSETGGFRRLSFWIEGQQVLVQHCSADGGLNDFAAGLLAAGPNVFRHCTATNALAASGAFESWASGILYEDVRIGGAALRLAYDSGRVQGGGWTAANAVVRNCTASVIVAKGHQTAPVLVQNEPGSLYEFQLRRRLGETGWALYTAVPSPGQSPAATAALPSFTLTNIPEQAPLPPAQKHPFRIVNGRFVVAGKTLWGGAVNDAWWLGFAAPSQAPDGGRSITRFIPGRVGTGLTEDLPQLARRATAQGTPFYQSGPFGLWYDRRRDEHSTKQRMDANVWAPFLEQPWARSGQGTAWDGLSRYDLTKFNPWYFSRLRQFASLADAEGLVLYHHAYNNHNLVEVGPHWVDFPWRPANNINATGLPEPPPFDSSHRIHVANEFYDIRQPALRELHRSYILHLLDSIGRSDNLVLCTGFQFFGPLAFQRFFQQTVAEWEQRQGQQVRIVLGTSKDITDSTLADPALARQVAVIDMRYWQYLPDGTLWAPAGGKNLAFREYVTEKFGRSVDFPNATTPQQAYRQVREYRDRYPDKAVVAWHNEVGPVPALMAGAAQVLRLNPAAGHRQGRIVDAQALDTFIRQHLEERLMHLLPRDGQLADAANNWMLADGERSTVLIYSLTGTDIRFLKKLPKKAFTGTWFDPRSGKTMPATLPRKLKKKSPVRKPTGDSWLLLLKG